jgi:hypothetical protein
MPSAWVDGSTITIGSNIYSVVNASFAVNDVVTINFDGVNKKGFFKSGGGGVTETLPQQVTTFTATSGNSVLNLAWTISDITALAGFYIVYKSGTVAPTTINDGTKIDLTDNTLRATTLSGLTNGTQYTVSIFPYNSKKQPQTIQKYVTATPANDNNFGSLAIGSKIVVTDPTTSADLTMIIIDKNHSGYPTNSVTLMLEKIIINNVPSASLYTTPNNVDAYLNDSVTTPTQFFKHLPTYLISNLMDTSITCATNYNASTTITRKAFALSIAELGRASVTGIVNEGVAFSYFTSDTLRKEGTPVAYWTRTPSMSTGGATGSYYTTLSDGSQGGSTASTSLGIRPVFNINMSNTIKLSLTTNANGYYTVTSY